MQKEVELISKLLARESFFLTFGDGRQDIQVEVGGQEKFVLMVSPTDYGRPMKPFFIEIPNFWAQADNLGK